MGMDLQTLPQEACVIPLSLDGTIEIGRLQQHGFFEQLLQQQPKWLNFISRAHLRVCLSRSPGSNTEGVAESTMKKVRASNSYVLKVENLSVNNVLVRGRPLPKGCNDAIGEGGSISFVASADGSPQSLFLEFVLRRARSSPSPAP